MGGSQSEANYGSSPLARGTLDARSARARIGRFIPARAGNTFLRVASASTLAGSSPLARGTHRRHRRHRRAQRFIPARAGNTAARLAHRAVPPVHPRSRGEHMREARFSRRCTGSSPLARGTLTGPAHRGAAHRFIPARAGNTRCCCSQSSRRSVHPRSRGEHSLSFADLADRNGSSPLARGTRMFPPYS